MTTPLDPTKELIVPDSERAASERYVRAFSLTSAGAPPFERPKNAEGKQLTIKELVDMAPVRELVDLSRQLMAYHLAWRVSGGLSVRTADYTVVTHGQRGPLDYEAGGRHTRGFIGASSPRATRVSSPVRSRDSEDMAGLTRLIGPIETSTWLRGRRSESYLSTNPLEQVALDSPATARVGAYLDAIKGLPAIAGASILTNTAETANSEFGQLSQRIAEAAGRPELGQVIGWTIASAASVRAGGYRADDISKVALARSGEAGLARHAFGHVLGDPTGQNPLEVTEANSLHAFAFYASTRTDELLSQLVREGTEQGFEPSWQRDARAAVSLPSRGLTSADLETFITPAMEMGGLSQ